METFNIIKKTFLINIKEFNYLFLFFIFAGIVSVFFELVGLSFFAIIVDTLIDIDNLKIFKKFEDKKEFFTVELMNIDSEEEGAKLCSILSSRQFSCLLLN